MCLPKECKFQISVTFSRLQGKFVVAMAVLDHENHEVSESIYLWHPSHRKLNTKEMNEVDNMLTQHRWQKCYTEMECLFV